MFGLYPPEQRWRVNLAVLLLIVGHGAAGRCRAAATRRWRRSASSSVYPGRSPSSCSAAACSACRWSRRRYGAGCADAGHRHRRHRRVACRSASCWRSAAARSCRSMRGALRSSSSSSMRGVPLITVLFMASVMLPLFLPPGVDFRQAAAGAGRHRPVLRRLHRRGRARRPAGDPQGPVRGGRCARPQLLADACADHPAAGAALVIPGIVNSFIGLFKDTTLVLIIGLFDLLGIVQRRRSPTPNWLGLSTRGLRLRGARLLDLLLRMSRYSHVRSSASCTPGTSAEAITMATGRGDARHRDDAARSSSSRGVHKWYGQFHVLKDINLDGRQGRADRRSAGRRARASRP